MALADDDKVAAAKAYVDALVSHDATHVRLHPDCTRTELGIKTGRSGGHIARSLTFGPQFRLIHQVSDFSATVDGDRVDTSYLVHVQPKFLRLSSRVTESFDFDEVGRITKIIATFSAPVRG
ncbi:hypothetical protein MUG78_08405 [Gordonia alkaliphila]|uniref:DUF8021 domain-containing protein n=1 Tax=Gordonia phosphorivorans TaxID=1056982 RepID=A0ABV6H7U3_9ACTN|nr:hypothetical protein [Gordonia alkaliphila]MCK0439481.1 hypothetical protein [Gordonia alkaliphila]